MYNLKSALEQAASVMHTFKRPGGELPHNELVVAKQGRMEMDVQQHGSIVSDGRRQRTSELFSPIMMLTGHSSEVFSSKFSPNGMILSSAGFDRSILMWSVFAEDCDNFAEMTGHTGAVLEITYNTDGSMLYSASTDKTIGVWDTESATRIKRLKGHGTFVNTVCAARRGPPLLVSGSDDATVKMWDIRKRTPSLTMDATYQVLSVAFSDTAEQIFSGGVDNVIKAWDVRNVAQPLYSMIAHSDSVTGLSLSPDGNYLLSNSMDHSLRVFDIRPFAPNERCLRQLVGLKHTFEKNLLRCCWSPDGSKISCGSGDRFVYVWDTNTGRVMYKLPGHTGSVNETHFHPTQPIIVSCSSDKNIYLGELQI